MLSTRGKIIVVLVFFLFMNWACSKAPLPTMPEDEENSAGERFGKIVVTCADLSGTLVDSAEVYLNSEFMGFTPFTKDDIMAGQHALRIQKDGYALYSESVLVQPEIPIFLEAFLEKIPMNKGQLLVTVNEDSAVTYLTNERSEIIDLFYDREKAFVLEPGGYFLKTEKPGFKLVHLAIEIGVDIVVVKNIQLEKVSDPALPEIVLAVPDSIQIEKPALVSWESHNAEGVDIDYIENPGLTGKREIIFHSEGWRYIKATARNEAGQISVKDSLYVFNPVAAPEKPPSLSISVQPKRVKIGENALIAWQAANASEVSVDYVPIAGLNGQWQIAFDTPGEYVIEAQATGPGGFCSTQDTLIVIEADEPMLQFSVSPAVVEFGEPVMVAWNSDANHVIIDQGIGVRGPSGNEEISFANPGMKIFTATAYGENGTTTTVVDSAFVKEPEQPDEPIVSLFVVDSVKVGVPVKIEWHSMNANRVDVDYVQNPGLNGKSEVVFQSEGQRIISATAYNATGQTTVAETLIVVAEEVGPQVEPLFLPVMKKVCAVHHTGPSSIENASEAYVAREGYYELTAEVWYNSGEYQKNESFFIRMRDAGGTVYPQTGNAGNDWVVPDDPGEPHLALREVGVFYLKQGTTTLELHHYYTISAQYPQFVIDGPITGAESVEVISVRAEFVGR